MTPELAHSEVKTNASDELDLVHACKRGNPAAFETLVKRYDGKLLRIANSVTHNIEDSQDAVQEAFLKAYQHLAEFREGLPILNLVDSHYFESVADEIAKAAFRWRGSIG